MFQRGKLTSYLLLLEKALALLAVICCNHVLFKIYRLVLLIDRIHQYNRFASFFV